MGPKPTSTFEKLLDGGDSSFSRAHRLSAEHNAETMIY